MVHHCAFFLHFFTGRASERDERFRVVPKKKQKDGNRSMAMGRKDEMIVMIIIIIIIVIIQAYRKITRRTQPLSSPKFF